MTHALIETRDFSYTLMRFASGFTRLKTFIISELRFWPALHRNRLRAAKDMAARQAVWTAVARRCMDFDTWRLSPSFTCCIPGLSRFLAGWGD